MVPRILTLILITLLLLIFNSTLCVEPPASDERATQKDVSSLHSWPAYKQLFETKRKAHLELMKKILGFNKSERQFKMLDLLYRKMKEVLNDARSRLTKAEYEPSESNFPADESLRDALSQVIENGVLFGDLALRFPTIVHRSFDDDKQMSDIISWSFKLIETTRAIEGTSADQTINLASQELRLTPRDPEFTNPFTSEDEIKISTLVQEEFIKQKKLKKKKTGPRLSRTEL